MNVSVIIPCKNEVGVVDNLLHDLSNQSTNPFEIIVVDSNSTDGLKQHLSGIEHRNTLRVIVCNEKGVANARNHGARHANGDLLLFLDADVRLHDTFLAAMLSEIGKRRLEAGGFTQRMISKKRGLRVGARMMNGYARGMQHTPWPIAYSCLFAKPHVHEAIDGFDNTLFIMEDYDYILQAKRRGYRTGIVTVPFLASDRRFVNAPPSTFLKASYAELYRYTHGLRITKPLFEYRMGGERTDLK